MSEHTTIEAERSNETVIESNALPTDESRSLRWGSYLLVLSGIGFVFDGVVMLYRVASRPASRRASTPSGA